MTSKGGQESRTHPGLLPTSSSFSPLTTRYQVPATRYFLISLLLDRLPTMLLDLPGEQVLEAGRVTADDRVHVLAVHEEQDAGDRPHVEPDGGPLVGIGVQLGDLHLAGQLIRQLVDGRSDGDAGSAPGGPEVHQGEALALLHLGGERVVGYMRDVAARHSL